MTEQIVIKLNKKKFQPIIDNIIKNGGNTSLTYSECVGKSLFFLYLYYNEKLPFLENKTKHEFLLERKGYLKDKAILNFLTKYNKFCTQMFDLERQGKF